MKARNALVALAATGALAGGGLLLAGPAGAHTLDITGKAVCSNSTWKITWNGQLSNAPADDTANLTGDYTATGVQPNSSFTFNTTAPGSAKTASVSVTATWYDHQGNKEFGPVQSTGETDLVGPCDTPTTPRSPSSTPPTSPSSTAPTSPSSSAPTSPPKSTPIPSTSRATPKSSTSSAPSSHSTSSSSRALKPHVSSSPCRLTNSTTNQGGTGANAGRNLAPSPCHISPVTSTSNLASTGNRTGWELALAAGLVLMGGGFMIVFRSRREH